MSEWIPTIEKLPKKTGLYLVSVGDLVITASFDGHVFLMHSVLKCMPDAWMKLPKPYKKGEKNDNGC